jgi:glutamate synthase (ferredoxin)
MLQKIKEAESAGLTGEAALVAAFEANAKDASRVGGS